MISIVILIAMIAVFFVMLHIAFQPTPDGKRINSDTVIRMLVDLPDSTPSRAITFTTDKTNDDKSYDRTIETYRNSALGGVEGDIPCVKLKENQKITLRFKDLDYNNLFPDDIKNVRADLTNVISDNEDTVSTDIEYSVRDGGIRVDPAQIRYEEDEETGEIWYNMALTVEYQYEGEDYTSVTAVTVFDK